jgi:hypothetical protein
VSDKPAAAAHASTMTAVIVTCLSVFIFVFTV